MEALSGLFFLPGMGFAHTRKGFSGAGCSWHPPSPPCAHFSLSAHSSRSLTSPRSSCLLPFL
uniref:Uncharacterized protein n=1 Tax=Anguilla anguilla TaxID=7936 RepID=A0A0E9PCA3_ANGAN